MRIEADRQPTNYYQQSEIVIEGKAETLHVDAAFAGRIASYAKGSISQMEAKDLVKALTDQGNGIQYGHGERPLYRALHAACRGKEVWIDGRRIRFTDPAAELFLLETSRWFGSMGPKVRLTNRSLPEPLRDGTERVRKNKYV